MLIAAWVVEAADTYPAQIILLLQQEIAKAEQAGLTTPRFICAVARAPTSAAKSNLAMIESIRAGPAVHRPPYNRGAGVSAGRLSNNM